MSAERTAPPGRAPAVFTIPAGVPFVDALAAGIRAKVGDAPEDLASALVLLPTRRACRALSEAFLRAGGGRPTLLPRLRPLGELDEDELAISGAFDLGGELPGEAGAGVAPAIPALRRQLLLTRMVLAMGRDAAPEQAARLAAELGRLLDQVHTERLDFAALGDLVPADFSEHWQITLEFLKILTENWPAVLAAEDAVDAADRRNRLLEAQSESWRRNPPAGLVVAAGSTGSIPATADLLDVVARLPQGCVVLPGLDGGLDAAAWAALDAGHPQYGMARLLEHFAVDPADVAEWPGVADFAAPPAERARLVRAALAPAALTDGWRDEAPFGPEATNGVSRIDCGGAHEEAGAIALVLRETLETPGRTAALVTPDRALARRVAAELRRWEVDIDDSAGVPLAHTPPATFLRLTAQMAAEAFAPVATLAVLKHPLAACGMPIGECRARVRMLEIAVLRGPRPNPGVAGLRAALGDQAGQFAPLLGAIEAAAAPFVDLLGRRDVPLDVLMAAHVEFAEKLAATDEAEGAARLWAGEAGEAVAHFIAELGESADCLDPIDGRHYAGLFDALLTGRVVRPRFGRHARLFIWGPLEARLQQADVVVLGGLNEGCWPPETAPGPWMSRPMMQAFGLPPPERRIGLSAHDFAQALAAPRVVLTRATRIEGTPTVPSRWLARLDALLGGNETVPTLAADTPWVAWFNSLDDPGGEPAPARPPEPRPPVDARPRRLSVSRVETWFRDPYAIFAREILKLESLPQIDADPADPAARGTIVHEALERFLGEYADALPADALDRLLAIGREVFGGAATRPGVRAFWWPRFERLAEWFVDYERRRREDGVRIAATETSGELVLAGPAGPFALRARADRIDRTSTGGLAIMDYKTGRVPSKKQVETHLAPQLTLEAAMAAEGAFAGLPAGSVEELVYLHLGGGRVPGKDTVIAEDVAGLATTALGRLRRMIAFYDLPGTSYPSRRAPQYETDVGDYDHLARVKEWITGGGDDE